LVTDGKRKDQTFASIGNGTRVVAVDPEDPNPPASGVITPYQFEMTYTPDNGANTGVLQVTVTDTEFIGTNPVGEGGGVRNTGTGVTTASDTFNFNLTSADRDMANVYVFDRFGLWSFGGGAPGPSSVQSIFLDDVTYTTQVPEPASLGLFGLASMFALRRTGRRKA
jgi:hypothetical protein